MKILLLVSLFLLPVTAFAGAPSDYELELGKEALAGCDARFKEIENRPDECDNMICRDLLVHHYAECWERSVEKGLARQLQPVQKELQAAVKRHCGKECGPGGTMKGIPWNFCRKDAYKYQAAVVALAGEKALSFPLENRFSTGKVRKGREKQKGTKAFRAFAKKLCALPKELWKEKPAKCEAEVLKDLDSYEFTDDVCDRS